MPATKYSHDLLPVIYDLARETMSNEQIAKEIGVARETMENWIKKKKLVKQFLEKARARLKSTPDVFLQYVYRRLPPDLADLYDEIEEYSTQQNGIRKIEALLKDKGKRVRQHLFLHALVASNFNPSEAMRKVNISYEKLKEWKDWDPGFAELIDEIDYHKKNFFDGALCQKVSEGDTLAILFANRTFNRDRYPTKYDLEINQKVEHTHTILHVHELDLPVDVKQQILEAYRKQKTLTLDSKVLNSKEVIENGNGHTD